MFDSELLIPTYGAEIDAKSELYENARKLALQGWTSNDNGLLVEAWRQYLEAFNTGVDRWR